MKYGRQPQKKLNGRRPQKSLNGIMFKEENLNFVQMENSLFFWKLEDDLDFFQNRRQPHFLKMEDDLKFLLPEENNATLCNRI
jgi:hypothetical protein